MTWANWSKLAVVMAALGGQPALLAAQDMAPAPPTTRDQPSTTGTLDAPAVVEQDLLQLAQRLSADASSQSERDDAARRLVSRQSDGARRILHRALQDAGNRPGQLAVAKALGEDPRPDAMFVNPLFALMGADRQLTDAAAAALSNYKDNDQVLARLINYTRGPNHRDARLAAIRALGGQIDRRAAAALMALLEDDQETPAIRNAAADALAMMTGLSENGRDPQRWQQWWADNRDRDDTQWRLRLLSDRAARFDRTQTRLGQMREEIQSILIGQYQSIPEAQRPDTLLRYLRSSEPAIRTVAARIIYDDAINSRPVSPQVREQLRNLIGDSAPEVRIAVARALQVINDPAALAPLLAQLAQEPDAEVRAELAKSLATIGDVRAVPALIELLKDPGPRVAEAAAKALRDLGGILRERDGAVAGAVADALRQALRRTTGDPDAIVYREALVEAMVVLRDPGLRDVFYQLLDQRTRESTGVRRAAVEALGELRDPKVADVLATALDDRDEVVRLEAVRALGKTSTFAQAEAIYAHLNPATESSERVRNEAWRVLQSLLPDAGKDQLQEWARRFVQQPDRRIIILKALADKQIRDKDQEQLALTRQNIGEAYMNLNQPADAAVYFRGALDYWQSRGGQEMVTQGLVRQTLEALLRSRQYDAALGFAGPLIAADPKNQEVVGALIRAEASRLLEAKDYAAVVSLVELSEKMTPRLDARYAGVLHSLADQARQAIQAQQQGPAGGGPRSALLSASGSVPTPG